MLGGTHIARTTAAAWAVIAAATAALVAALAAIGEPGLRAASALTALYLVVASGAPAAFYLLAGIGLGRLFAPLTRDAADPAPIRAALGLALMLTTSHALGCFGLLAGAPGRIVAILPCGVGVVLLALDARRWRPAPPFPVIAIIPGLALLLVAAVQPPGWLWRSEFGGFDALSYHLQLPQEWLARGRIEPLEHNVYSWLPGYVEAAFLHLAAILGLPPPRPGAPAFGLAAGDGGGAIACQLLHAGFALVTAWMIARCGRLLSSRDPQASARWAAPALFLATPWIIVVGSLAYNDLGVLVLGAGAFAAAFDPGLTPTRRGAVTGLLVGVACGCKPTALLFLGGPLALLILGSTPPRQWFALIAAGVPAGLAALAPWLLRNTLYAGNPVFPYLTAIFGDAHWSPEQAARFTRATFSNDPLIDRLALLIAEDPRDPAGPRHRGLFHFQWFAFFPIVAAAALAACVRRDTRRAAVLLAGAMLIQIGAWLYASHLQSRFLLPLAIPATLLTAVAAARPPGKERPRVRLAAMLAVHAAILFQAGASFWNFTRQQRERPNRLLVAGPAFLTGALFETWDQAEHAGAGGPGAFLNLALPPGRTVYLLGDATPFYIAPPLLYNTVWDRSPLAQAVRADPDHPARWADDLRRADVRYVLVNFAELDRYRRSGYIDPTLTPETVDRFLAAHARPVREWPHGPALFELIDAAPGDPP